jgi:hypothetical protein
MKPLCIDLFCGLGGWAEGFLAEGWDVAGFDIERHNYGSGGYPGRLVLQNVLTLHGSQFRDADCIVASPPCQEYSYMAMPWKRSEQITKALRHSSDMDSRVPFPKGYKGSRSLEELNALFDACFLLQWKACEASGRDIPLIVENVCGAQKWVGRAKWHYGSYYLWGDVPALMPYTFRPSVKIASESGRRTDVGNRVRFTSRDCGIEGIKQPGHSGRKWFADHDVAGRFPGKSPARKAASAEIAKIPFELATWIARCFKPEEIAA